MYSHLLISIGCDTAMDNHDTQFPSLGFGTEDLQEALLALLWNLCSGCIAQAIAHTQTGHTGISGPWLQWVFDPKLFRLENVNEEQSCQNLMRLSHV